MSKTLIVVEVINLSVKKDFPLKNLMRGLSKKIVKEIEDKWKDKEKEREWNRKTVAQSKAPSKKNEMIWIQPIFIK